MISKGVLLNFFIMLTSVSVLSVEANAAKLAKMNCLQVTEGGLGGAALAHSNAKYTKISFDGGFTSDLQIQPGRNFRSLNLVTNALRSAGQLSLDEIAIGFTVDLLDRKCSWFGSELEAKLSCAADDIPEDLVYSVDLQVIGPEGRRNISNIFTTKNIRASSKVIALDPSEPMVKNGREFVLSLSNNEIQGSEIELPYLNVLLNFTKSQCVLDVSEF